MRSPGYPLIVITRRGRVPSGEELERMSKHAHVRTYRLKPGDIIQIGEQAVTSRARTVFDLLRSSEAFTVARRTACRMLLFDDADEFLRLAQSMRHASRTDFRRTSHRLEQLTGIAVTHANRS